MPRRRFFVPSENFHHGVAELPADQAHHLRAVLRLGPGDIVEIFDGTGANYMGRIESAGETARIAILEKIEPGPHPVLNLILGLALIKSERFDWALQKAAELGVSAIVPLETRFCDVRVPESRRASRAERWRRIVREAAKQCRRSTVPEVRQPIDWTTFLRLPEWKDADRILFYEKAAHTWDPKRSLDSRRIVLCIGPEGGWDSREVEAASAAGFRLFGLGPRVLRAETAVVAALAILQFQHGDMQPETV